MSTPFFFREASIVDIDPVNLTCELLYGDPNLGEISHAVPMPNLIGAGNAGLIANLKIGTRVIAAYLHDKSKETVVIIAVLPSNLQKRDDYNSQSSYLQDKNAGTISYPKNLGDGEVYLSAHSGPNIWLKNNDSLYLSSADGNGLFLMPGPSNTHNMFYLANNHSIEGSGGRLSWGRVKRNFANLGWSTVKNFGTDLSRDNKLSDVGFWFGDRVSLVSNRILNRNPALSEYKIIINEFASEFGVFGLDKESEKSKNQYLASGKNPNLSRDMESTNSLRLSESELIEIIGGNLVDINGLILDVNYNPVFYSPTFPTVDANLKIEEAIRKSRRGIGYHFKLSTNSKSTDFSNSLKDFIFDVDKEGVLKVNIPKSSSTGNIPYLNNVNFASQSNQRILNISAANPTIREKIPVNLKDRDGKIQDQKPPGTIYRETGIRFANYSNDLYFPIGDQSGKKTIRVNTTKHHNIYAAAERLIANYITEVHIPAAFTREKSLSIGGQDLGQVADIPSDPNEYSRHSSFEVKYKPISAGSDPANNKTDVKNLFYSTVAVTPSVPAISTGGETFVAGKAYNSDDQRQPVISNYFKTTEGDSGIEVSPDKVYQNVVTHGGVSANVNMEGSLELSLGKDNVDNKSLILDTAGSLVMWLGKDKNNRSLIFQSDGDVMVNVGGSYTPNQNPSVDPVFNPGRFDLRVNVVDKGFHDSSESRSSGGAITTEDKPYSSDYLISISDKGLVISGMKAGAPMIIRNDGPVMMESASDKLILKGMQVEIVEFAKLPTDDGRANR
jgi:hypothetical protein